MLAKTHSFILAAVVQKQDNAIHRITHYPVDSVIPAHFEQLR